MAVQARLYVAETTEYASQYREGFANPSPRGVVKMRQVTRGEANKEWASATPQAEFTMTVNGDGFEWFRSRLGKELAITIDDRDPAETAD